MSDTGPAVDAAPAPMDYQPPAISQEALSIDDAMRLWSEPPKETQAESAEPPQAATAEPEPAQAETAQAEEPASSEEPEATEAETPPIEPPRSWTKEAKERWSALPRETQEYLAQREQERDRGLNRSQNELAEQRKAIEAERSKAEQARKDYEAKLPALMQALNDANAGVFADIRTIDDVTKLAAEDPFRYLQWQAHQSKMAAVQAEVDRSNQDKATEDHRKWADHVQTEGQRFAEALSTQDKANLKSLMEAAPAFLNDRGFTNEELTSLWQGKEKISLHDHRLQSLILDGMKYRDLQKAPLKAAPKPLPPVQRPGVAAPRGAAKAQNVQSLTHKLSASGSIDDAMELLMAQRANR